MKRELPFTEKEYQQRLDNLRAGMEERGVGVMILTSAVAINYLAGSLNSGPQYLVVPLEGEPLILAWAFDLPLVLYTSWLRGGIGFATGQDELLALREVLDERGLSGSTIAIEKDSPNLSAQNTDRLLSALEGCEVIDGSGLFLPLLRIKSPREIAYIKEATRFTEEAMAAAIDATRAGATDNEVAAAAHQAAIEVGSEAMCSMWVTTGLRSGIPHTSYLRNTIEEGDPVCLEIAGNYERYNAPLMRTVFVGEPPAGALELGQAAMSALETVLAISGPGMIAEDIAAVACKELPLDDPEILFHHTYGYSIGLGFPRTWADDPNLTLIKGHTFALEPGMVFHCTMSPRRRARYGIFLSETFTVTEDGCEVLTNFPRQFFFK
jgi:Xaa-Pro dipeptidase